ncbi:MAG TPA: hypothetical protein PKB05_02820 [Oligoflexia bacterium]|nr:hypothetical protein [Oligoflexia bacterium]
MLNFGSKETLKEIADIPKPNPGAPIPWILSNDSDLYLSFYTSEKTFESYQNISSNNLKVTNYEKDCVVTVVFKSFCKYMVGLPNDEVLSSHALYNKGLDSLYNAEVINSSWIVELEKMNSVHPSHNREWFLKDLKHFIITFKNNIFECVAKGYDVSLSLGSPYQSIREIINTD